jgi:regulatory protein
MDNSLESTKKRALKILGNRNFSESEMIKRLTSKGETQEDAEETTSWLVELGYINDVSYALLIVEHYSFKGYGIARVKDELYKRGIPRDLWDSALAALDNEGVSDAALAFLHKKLRGSNDENDIRKAKDALVRRGFSYEDAKIALNAYLESTD